MFFYLLTLTCMSLMRFFSFIQMNVFDRDRYLAHINSFEGKSFYDQIAYGTSVVFNGVIYLIDFFVKNLDVSFTILNIISVILLGWIGGVIVYSNKSNYKWLNILFVPLFLLFWLNDEQVQWTNNDIFLSVIVLLIYLILFTPYKLINKTISLGVLLALLFSTRLYFSLVLVPAFAFCFIVFCIHKSITIKKVLVFIGVFCVGMLMFNFPSLIEKGKLSAYVKGGDYASYNTVGTLRMFDEHRVKLIRKEIYVESSSTEFVEEYKKLHNIKELPKGVLRFMIAYPVYYLKLFGLNVVNLSLYLFRRYAFLLILPLLSLYVNLKNDSIKAIFSKQQLPFMMFMISCFSLLLVLHTVIEFRWLDTIEFLIVFSIFKALHDLYKRKYKIKRLNIIVVLSLLLLTIFNVRTVINMFY